MTAGTVLIVGDGLAARQGVHAAARRGWRTAVGYRDEDAFSAFVREADSAHPLRDADPAEPSTWIDVAGRADATAVWIANSPRGSVRGFGIALEKAGLTGLGTAPVAVSDPDPEVGRALAHAAGVAGIPSARVMDARDLDAFVGRYGTPSEIAGAAGTLSITSPRDVEDIASGMRGDQEGVLVRRAFPHRRRIALSARRTADGEVDILTTIGVTRDRNGDVVLLETPALCADDLRARLVDSTRRLAEAAHLVGIFIAEFVVGEDSDPLWDASRPLSPLGPAERMAVGCALDEDAASLELDGEPTRVPRSPRHTVTVAVRAEYPIPGTVRVSSATLPAGPGIRAATSIDDDGVVQTADGLIAAVAAIAGGREDALRRARRAVHEHHLPGLSTNLASLQALLSSEVIVGGAPPTEALDALSGVVFPPAFAVHAPPLSIDRTAITIDRQVAHLLVLQEG